MEDDIGRAIFRPAGIYPGNSNTPELFGYLNQLLNPVLPRVYNTVGSTAIGLAMMNTMRRQLSGSVLGRIVVEGGAAIGTAAK